MANKQQLLAIFELQDQLRTDAAECIAALKAAGMQVTLLSGDKQSVADHIGKKLGIETVIAEQLPDQKLAYLKSKQSAGRLVIMVGDGVNDAPVLAAANVSIAMGEGSQLAQVTADMVLMSDSLKSVPEAIQMAKRTRVIIRENFAWAILYNLLAMPMATLGLLAPWMAAIGMSLSSLLVVLNALRLKR
jgi:Cu2+-exporting ATPase